MGTATTSELESPERHREKLHGIVAGARNVMLLTHAEQGRIAGRPMHLVRTDDDTTLYLVTSIDSGKIAELEREPRAAVAIQVRDGYAIIDGEIRVSRDRSLIDELWQDSWKVWFPNGKDDPSIAILIVSPIEGTYWDADLGTGISYLYRMVKARLTGTEIERTPGDTGHVDLRRH